MEGITLMGSLLPVAFKFLVLNVNQKQNKSLRTKQIVLKKGVLKRLTSLVSQ